VVGLAVPATASKGGLVLPPVVKPAKSIPWKPLPGSVHLTSAAAVKADLAAAPPLSRVFPWKPQVDVPFNYDYFNTSLTSDCRPVVGNKAASPGFPGSCPLTLPWSDPRIAHTVAGCSPDQVALKWWGTATGGPAVLVSWAACDSAYLMTADPDPLDAAAVPYGLRTGSKPGVYGEAWNVTQYAYTVDYYSTNSSTNGGVYVSPVLHHALVRGLKPGELVFYRIDGPPGTQPFAGSFRVPGGFPLRVVAAADVGQIANTTTSLAFWEKMSPDLLLLPGDLSYADDVGDFNMFYDWDQAELLYDNINTVRGCVCARVRVPLCFCTPSPSPTHPAHSHSHSFRRAGTPGLASCPRWRRRSPS
jgi:hypothetical protein